MWWGQNMVSRCIQKIALKGKMYFNSFSDNPFALWTSSSNDVETFSQKNRKMSNISESQKANLAVNNSVGPQKSTTSLNRVKTEDNRREETFDEIQSQALDKLVEKRSPIMNKTLSKKTSFLSPKEDGKEKEEEAKSMGGLIFRWFRHYQNTGHWSNN